MKILTQFFNPKFSFYTSDSQFLSILLVIKCYYFQIIYKLSKMKPFIFMIVAFLSVTYGQKAEKLVSQNPCASKTTCRDCIQTPTCAWCFQPVSFNKSL